MQTSSFVENNTTNKKHPAVIKILEVLFCLKNLSFKTRNKL
jgi:hypothetical protein